jgi:pSer/pThr/pTyr-binding forkhead associated (FHA) protein
MEPLVARRLQIISGKKEGSTFELTPGVYLVGTRKASDIQLRDKGVGFKHAKIVVEDEQILIEDLKSNGGTWIGDEKLDPSTPTLVPAGSALKFGTVSLRLETDEEPVTEEPVAEEPVAEEPVAEEPVTEEPVAEEPVTEEPVAEEPEPAAVEPLAEAEPAPEAEPRAKREPVRLTPLDELPSDVDLLKERFRDLERRYAEKSQEAQAYEEALEATTQGGMDDGLGGFSDEISGDLEQRVLDLQLVADEKSAEALEKDDVVKALEREIEVLRSRSSDEKDRTEKERLSIAEDILKGHARLEEQKQTVTEARAEVSQFEEVNAELLLETEDLKDKMGILEHQLEVERAERGKLIRERLVALRQEIERLDYSNAELRTLVEAYEEKIDELVEELEGENEAHEGLVLDLRRDLAKAKQDRDTMVKTLRKKLQGVERKLERAQNDKARARAAEASTGT